MKRTKNKPSLLVVLAVFVGLGVLISTYTQSTNPNANAKAATAKSQETSTSKTTNKVYTQNFIKVSDPANSPLPKDPNN